MQPEVTTLDLLNQLPGKVIHFDLDGWIQVARSLRNALNLQQKMIVDLGKLSIGDNEIVDKNPISNELKETKYELVPLTVSHRTNPINIEVWTPSTRSIKRESLVVLMPGLGGDQYHFRWLARSLSHNGWPVMVLEHPGSDTDAIQALLEGSLPVPGAEVIPDRLADLNAVLRAREENSLEIKGKKIILMGHSLGALTAFFASGATPVEDLETRCKKALDHLSLTNLSALLQCQMIDVVLPNQNKIENLAGIVGINSFGSLLWPDNSLDQGDIPVLLTGGTFDLITPAVSEQLGLLVATKPNNLSRVLLVEGGSHFSPIRVEGQLNKSTAGDDLFQLGESLVGVHPLSVQSLLAEEIIRFIDGLEKDKEVKVSINYLKRGLKYHILDRSTIIKFIDVQ